MFVRKRKENDSEKLHSAILERKNDGNFGKSVCGFFSGWRFCGMLGLLLQRLCGDVLWLAALTMTLAMASPILILIWKILLFKEERTASCKLYPRSFCDFSSGIGGDIIRFASAVLGLNNWEACRYLIEAFSLPFSLSGHTDNRGRYAAVSRRDSGSRKRNGDLKQRGWQRRTGSRHGRTFISGPLQKRYSLPCLICRHSQSENCRRYLMSWMCFAYMAAGGSRRPY